MLNRGHRLCAVAALADHLDVLLLLQQRQHALARQRLVVDDQGSDLVHATLSMPDRSAQAPATVPCRSALNGMTIGHEQSAAGRGRGTRSDGGRRRGARAATACSTGRRLCRERRRCRCRPTPLSRTSSRRFSPSRVRDDIHAAAADLRPDPVADRVLDERLQDEVGHRAHRACRDRCRCAPADDRRSASVRSRGTSGGSRARPSARLLRADAIEREAQQIAEPREHRVGGFDVAVHQRRDRVERVEEEVRVQLPLQRLQLASASRVCELRGRSARAPAPRGGSRARGCRPTMAQ